MVAQLVIRTGLRRYCFFVICCGKMSGPVDNAPVGTEDAPGGDGAAEDQTAGAEAVITTPPAKRRGGVVSLSMGAAPRTGLIPGSPPAVEHYEDASPRQGCSALAGARKRQASATLDMARTLSALPATADAAAAQMLSPGPDASMEELRGFCVIVFNNNDKAFVEVVNKMKADHEAENKVAFSVNDRLLSVV